MKNDSGRLVQVFSGDVWKAKMIESMFLEHDLPCMVKNEHMSSIESPAVSAGGFNAAEVWVAAENAELAGQLVQEFFS
ncbi:putative signal transducing protein [Pedobacter deserti]|uniref:putative signal transducing protein n=1 Tax=Pedobacter deserti TaxID=2817382 RepID=UPI0021087BD5|nr:DUF2007 domain-containing protein [Pedobacter sp. SYSU D00382]